MVADNTVRLRYPILYDPLSVLGWKYADGCAKGLDWISYQLGYPPYGASFQTIFCSVLADPPLVDAPGF